MKPAFCWALRSLSCSISSCCLTFCACSCFFFSCISCCHFTACFFSFYFRSLLLDPLCPFRHTATSLSFFVFRAFSFSLFCFISCCCCLFVCLSVCLVVCLFVGGYCFLMNKHTHTQTPILCLSLSLVCACVFLHIPIHTRTQADASDCMHTVLDSNNIYLSKLSDTMYNSIWITLDSYYIIR